MRNHEIEVSRNIQSTEQLEHSLVLIHRGLKYFRNDPLLSLSRTVISPATQNVGEITSTRLLIVASYRFNSPTVSSLIRFRHFPFRASGFAIWAGFHFCRICALARTGKVLSVNGLRQSGESGLSRSRVHIHRLQVVDAELFKPLGLSFIRGTLAE